MLRNVKVPSLQGRSFRVREPAAALLWSRRSFKKSPENTKILLSDPENTEILLCDPVRGSGRQELPAVGVRNSWVHQKYSSFFKL